MAQASGQKFAMMTGPGHIYISCIGTGEDLREYIESRYSIDLFLIMKLQFGSCLLVVPTVMLYRAIGRHGAGANQLARWIYRIKESPYINIIPCTILYGFFCIYSENALVAQTSSSGSLPFPPVTTAPYYNELSEVAYS